MELNKINNMKDTCVAFGTFESVHKGHLAVADEVVRVSGEKDLTSVIVSCPKDGQVLATEEEKEYLLQKRGIHTVISGVWELPEEELIKKVIIETLGARVIVTGAEYTGLEQLKEIAREQNVAVVVCETQKEDGQVITAELVKEAFFKCDFEKYKSLCGHPYLMIGEVMHGKALGRTVGMPTANLGVEDVKLKPLSGVYATSIQIEDELFKSMTNIGKRPSVDSFDYVTIEAFILDFARDIYGKRVMLEVYKFVRGVQKFDSLEEVQKQVQKDIQAVRDGLELEVK